MNSIFKAIIFSVFFLLFFSLSPNKVFAVFDPSSFPNNKFGIHILFPDEIKEAAALVNSNGGDWGYAVIPIQASDRNLEKWQKFMDDCKNNHIIPVIRLSTDGDYFNTVSWEKPNLNTILDFSNFLNSLSWPIKNRYIVVYNEVNRGDEWGGSPNPAEYAEVLEYASEIFKQKSSDFYIISAGLDNAAPNKTGEYINEYEFLKQMQASKPNIFNKIDALASHSYPNPGFSQPPEPFSKTGVNSFKYEQQLVSDLSGKTLPVFITETGWSAEAISDSKIAEYYKKTFSSEWNDESLISISPFLLKAGAGPFTKFALIDGSGVKNKRYEAIKNIQKNKGEPLINFISTNLAKSPKIDPLPEKNFLNKNLKNNPIFKSIASKEFLKWLLNIR